MGRNLGCGNSNIFLFSPLIIEGRWKLIFDLRIFYQMGWNDQNHHEVVSYLCDDHPIHQKGLRSHKSCLSCLRATLVKVPMMIGEICWDWRDTAIFGICLFFKQFKEVVCKRNLSGWFFWSFGTDVSVLTCFCVFFLVKYHLIGGRYGHNEAWKDLSLRCTAGDVAVPVWQLRGLSISSWLGLGWWKATGTTTWIFFTSNGFAACPGHACNHRGAHPRANDGSKGSRGCAILSWGRWWFDHWRIPWRGETTWSATSSQLEKSCSLLLWSATWGPWRLPGGPGVWEFRLRWGWAGVFGWLGGFWKTRRHRRQLKEPPLLE